jgi:Family of unknown function (DUF5412)
VNEGHRQRWLYMKIAQFIQANRQLAITIALVIGLVIAILVSVYLSLAAWIGSGSGTCGTEVVQEVVSPQGHLVAAQYERNCGATTDYVNGVAIRRRDQAFRYEDSAIVYYVEGHGKFDLKWAAEDHLIINERGSRFKDEERWHNVRITHK